MGTEEIWKRKYGERKYGGRGNMGTDYPFTYFPGSPLEIGDPLSEASKGVPVWLPSAQ